MVDIFELLNANVRLLKSYCFRQKVIHGILSATGARVYVRREILQVGQKNMREIFFISTLCRTAILY